MVTATYALVVYAALVAHSQVTNAWDTESSCPGCACDIRSQEEGGSATRFDSPVAETANKLLHSTNPKQGILVRAADGMQSSWLPASHVNVAMKPPNPMYVAPPGHDASIHCPPTTNPMPNVCEGHPSDYYIDECNGLLPNAYIYAGVGLLYGTKYKLNEGHDAYVGGDIEANIEACYPTDSNAMDDWGRAWYDNAVSDQGRNGRGCHKDQDFGCNQNGSTCITTDESACRCDFKAVPGKDAATWMITESLTQFGSTGTGRWGDAAKCAVNYDQIKQASFQADYISCWAEPSDFGSIVDMTNSFWRERDGWLNWQNPVRMPNDISYMGWTECPARWGDKTDLKSQREAADAVVIVLPAMQNRMDESGEPHVISICDLSPDAIQGLETSLKAIPNNFLDLPVVVMEQKNGTSAEECNTHWDGEDCNDGYLKGIFSQNYLFPEESCLLQKGGDPEARYYESGSDECKAYKEYLYGRDSAKPTPSPSSQASLVSCTLPFVLTFITIIASIAV